MIKAVREIFYGNLEIEGNVIPSKLSSLFG